MGSGFSGRSTIEWVFVLAFSVFVVGRLARSCAILTEDELIIRNPLATRRIARFRVAEFDIGRGNGLHVTGLVHLKDGATHKIWGIQPPNKLTRSGNRSADDLVSEMNEYLHERTRS